MGSLLLPDLPTVKMAGRLFMRRATQSMRALAVQPRVNTTAMMPSIQPIFGSVARFSSAGPEKQLPMEPLYEVGPHTRDEGQPTVGLQAYEQTLGNVGLDKNFSGHFGTKENPVVIESLYPTRVMAFMVGDNSENCD